MKLRRVISQMNLYSNILFNFLASISYSDCFWNKIKKYAQSKVLYKQVQLQHKSNFTNIITSSFVHNFFVVSFQSLLTFELSIDLCMKLVIFSLKKSNLLRKWRSRCEWTEKIWIFAAVRYSWRKQLLFWKTLVHKML